MNENNTYANICNYIMRDNATLLSAELSKGVSYEVINRPNNDGKTPLHRASSNGHLEVAKLLVEAGANVNITDKSGNTPYQFALMNGYRSLANYLQTASQLTQRSTLPSQAEVEELRRTISTQKTEIAILNKQNESNELLIASLQASVKNNQEQAKKQLSEKDVMIAELESHIKALLSAPPSACTTCTTSRQLGGDTTSLTAAEVRLMQTNRELEARVAQLQAVVDQPNCIPYGVFVWTAKEEKQAAQDRKLETLRQQTAPPAPAPQAAVQAAAQAAAAFTHETTASEEPATSTEESDEWQFDCTSDYNDAEVAATSDNDATTDDDFWMHGGSDVSTVVSTTKPARGSPADFVFVEEADHGATYHPVYGMLGPNFYESSDSFISDGMYDEYY